MVTSCWSVRSKQPTRGKMLEKLAVEDKEKALDLVKDLQNKVNDVITQVQGQLQKAESGEWSTAKGVSLLEVKYQMLLSYIINLTQLLCVKVRGQSIQNDPTIDRLTEIRTVLEKMRPIDQKLKYQIDKLLKTATTGTLGENDPLRLKPNPDNLQSKFEDENEEGSSEDEKPDTSKVYKPPKISAVVYDGDETQQDQKEKLMKRAQKRALSSSVMQDLRAEYDDAPTEIRETSDLHRMKEDRAGKERNEYEEKYFVRTAVSKKERNAAKKIRTMSGLDDVTRFGDMSALTGEGNADDELQRKKRKKGTPKGKKGKVAKKYKRRK